ncbi:MULTISPECIES: hypothetical protein [Sphingomonas]|nr:hypothetical protein [Sphingomonas sp. CCH10-B3]
MADTQSKAAQERADRLAAALRDNLRKRKARARGTTPERDTDAAPDNA